MLGDGRLVERKATGIAFKMNYTVSTLCLNCMLQINDDSSNRSLDIFIHSLYLIIRKCQSPVTKKNNKYMKSL